MKCYFIDWTTNWADEMDIYSAEVLTETELKDFKNWLTKNKNKLEDGIEYCIGTNEDLDLSYNDIKETIKNAQEITETEYICFNVSSNASLGISGGTQLTNCVIIERPTEKSFSKDEIPFNFYFTSASGVTFWLGSI